MSPEKKGDKAPGTGPAEKFQALADKIRLRKPVLPGSPPAPPPPAPHKYPLLQELAAERQEARDAFSKLQLSLLEIRNRPRPEIPAEEPGDAGEKPPEQAARKPEAPSRAPAAVAPASSHGAAALPADGPPTVPSPSRAAGIRYAVLSAAAALGIFWFMTADNGSTIALPPASAAGLCLDKGGEHIFFVDPLRQLLITVATGEKRVRSVQSFQLPGLTAVACDGAAFWSSDGGSIYSHANSPGYPATEAYKPSGGIRSLSLDGGKLWAAADDGKLTAFQPGAPKAAGAVYNIPGARTDLAAVADGKLWTLDPYTGVLRAFSIAEGMKPLAEKNIKSRLPRGPLAGIAVSGGTMWMITAGPAELVRVTVKDLKL